MSQQISHIIVDIVYASRSFYLSFVCKGRFFVELRTHTNTDTLSPNLDFLSYQEISVVYYYLQRKT